MKEGIARVALSLLAGALFFGPPAAQAANQLFEGSWSIKAFGNECSVAATGSAPGPHCGGLSWPGEFRFYSALGFPQGIQCNPYQPRCPFSSTPTNGTGNFAWLGGSHMQALFCAPWADWQGNGTSMRPAKGATATTGGKNKLPIPPLYRNPGFFTSGGQPGTTDCTAASTGATPGGRGRVQAGNPVAGKWTAATIMTGSQKGGFSFAAAPVNHVFGIRTGQGTRTLLGGQGSARSGRIGELSDGGCYVECGKWWCSGVCKRGGIHTFTHTPTRRFAMTRASSARATGRVASISRPSRAPQQSRAST